VSEDSTFARIVSLACHDLRTPLATVLGFARTIPRVTELPEQPARHLAMIDAAASEMAALLDQLGLLARIERDAYEPNLIERDSLELMQGAAEQAAGTIAVEGTGTTVRVDPEAIERALAALARALLRHGGLDEVRAEVRGPEIALSPTTEESAAVAGGDELRDLGAAVARKVLDAGGGSVSLDGDSVVVRLPE
jgi:signal transduction histidine kinase